MNDQQKKDKINEVFNNSLSDLKSMFSLVNNKIKKVINEQNKIESQVKVDELKASLLNKFNLN